MQILQENRTTQPIYSKTLPVKAAVSFVKPVIKAERRANNHLELGFPLLAEAQRQNDIPSMIDADFLIESGSYDSGNNCYFENLSDSKGREFCAAVQFVSLPTRLDNGSQRKNAYASRKRIIEQFKSAQSQIKKEKLFPFLITPTFPNLVGKTIEQNVKFIDAVARTFRDSDYYIQTIRGAIKKTEFTNGGARERRKLKIPFNYRTFGYNFHNHYLCVSSVDFADTSKDCKKHCKSNHEHIYNYKNPKNLKLAKLYTKILKQVHFDMFQEEFLFPTESKLAVVDIRPVDLSDEGKGIAYEAGKYLAKHNTFSDLEPKELLSANNIFKNKKLISATGIFTKKNGRRKSTKVSNSNSLQEKDSSQSLDKHPSSINSKILSSIISNTPEKENKILSSILESYFDNSCKTLSLKNLGIKLCENGARELWLKILKIEFRIKVDKARKKFLERHPNAIVTDLQNKTYSEHRKSYSHLEKQVNILNKTRHLFKNSVSVSH